MKALCKMNLFRLLFFSIITLIALPVQSQDAAALDEDLFWMDQDNDDPYFVPSLLHDFRDVFESFATFQMGGPAWFNMRGYDNKYQRVLLYGVEMENLENGFGLWNRWSGLNRSIIINRNHYMNATSGIYSGIGGFMYINPSRPNGRKQLNVSYTSANTTYDHRLMATYSTGIMKSGWSVALSASRRYASEAAIPGTFMNAWSYYMSIKKTFGLRHNFNFVTLGAPIERGRASASHPEMHEYGGNLYNPNWGYLAGQKLNSRISKTHQPVFLLNHEWKMKEQGRINTSLMYMFGRDGTTRLEWYNARDPRPDYYRKLPGFIELTDPLSAEKVRQELIDNPLSRQINFDDLYRTNRNPGSVETILNAGGIEGNDISGYRARYIIEENRFDMQKVGLNSIYESLFKDKTNVSAGIYYHWQRTHNFKVVNNLLGADYFVDRNQFAEREFPTNDDVAQSDLNNPNRVVRVGDVFGHNYYSTICYKGAWAQVEHFTKKVDMHASAEISHTGMYREGKMRVGLFPDISEGKSDKLNFINVIAKAGATYKINGRNYISLNGQYQTKAPYFNDIFVSARTRNQTIENPVNEKIFGFETGYYLRANKIKSSIVLYYTQFMDEAQNISFFHDEFRTFVNYSLSNMDRRHMGMELATRVKVTSTFDISAVASIGEYVYTSRPNATITQDNSNEILKGETIYMKNSYVPRSPQMAFTTGLHYNAPQFWFVNVFFNFADRLFEQINPTRRTLAAIDGIEEGSDLIGAILEQKKMPTIFTVDLMGGYSWKMDKTFPKMKSAHYLSLFLGVNNLLNNKSIQIQGSEQLRFDFRGKNPDRFPPLYRYAQGTTYFLMLTYRM